ncbi:MAG: hypothetical protein KF768_13100, partial [Phycisphaeraceae bacterium]|nr:hypothetical protein [Phycisphaeraceae bacterium]
RRGAVAREEVAVGATPPPLATIERPFHGLEEEGCGGNGGSVPGLGGTAPPSLAGFEGGLADGGGT